MRELHTVGQRSEHRVIVGETLRQERDSVTSVNGTARNGNVGQWLSVAGQCRSPSDEPREVFAASEAGFGKGAHGRYRSERERLSVALERFLDFLEHEPQQPSQSPQDPIKRLADFLSSDWWRFKR
jgi:hypothetical protein